MTETVTPTFHNLDLTLGHLLHADASTPWTVLLRVLPAAIRRGYPVPVIRRWVTSRSRREDVTTLASSPTWHRAVAASRQLVRGTATADGLRARRLQVAGRMVGRLLSPVPAGVTPLVAQGARMAVVMVGLEALDRLTLERPESERIDTPRLSRGVVAVRLGVSEPTAQKWLTAAERLGWLGRGDHVIRGPGGHGSGHAGIRRLLQLDADAGAIAWVHAELVDALVDGNEDAAATLVRSATHPAWCYRVGHRHWLVALARAVNVEPVARFGIPDRAVRSAVRGLDRAGLVDWTERELLDRLNELAREAGPDGGPSAMVEAAAADARRAQLAADRKAAVLELRAARDAERAADRRHAARAARSAGDGPRTEPGGGKAPAARRTIRLPDDWSERGGEAQLRAVLAARGMLVVAVSSAERTVTVEMVAARGLPADAGTGDRGEDRVDAVADDPQGPDPGAAAVVRAAGPGRPGRVRPRRGRPVRPVVPAAADPGRWRGRGDRAGAGDDVGTRGSRTQS
ncbi:hypothetical protein CBP52_06555 [Cellulomonas sp. PSBB021]|nr:hypothetical protein CBP52_06555 [Cellulomonas sp. PSBB021]